MKNIIYITALLFTIVVKAQTYYTEPITSTTPYLGQTASATLEILLRSPSLQIENPLIVVEGFDSGLLGVENPFGEKDLRDFVDEAIDDTGGLPAQLNTYDIIYVNWVNGNDYLQRNAALLKDIIEWVNTNKTGNTPNVVLGQSMGGVIARYALRDMELNSNETHDTSLYISHDAPHQGANIPLSIQYFARHLVDQFVSTPLGDMNINISGTGGPVTIDDVKTLLDAPGTKQLLTNSINSGFALDNNTHDTWQTELQNKGYPQLTRNIAISNGNHCANPQIYNPDDELFVLNGDGKTGLLTDFLIQFLGPLNAINDLTFIALAVLFNEPGLLIGILPGNSKFNMDFNAKALPNVGVTSQIYKGKITFTKKILWLINLTVNLTNRSYNNPINNLSYDYYPGGYYDVFFNFSNSSASGVLGSYNINADIVDNFNFIPNPSALDIGGGNVALNNNDYFMKYNAQTPPSVPKNTPFANFTTAYTLGSDLNEEHISFNTSNGNWLATELDNDTNNNEVFDCSYICSDAKISGNDNLCTSGSYSVSNGATFYNWTITKGASLVSMSGNGTSNITLTKNGSSSGFITIQVSFGDNGAKCGNKVFVKKIWVGKPTINMPLPGPGPGQSTTFCQTYNQELQNFILVDAEGIPFFTANSDWEWTAISNNFYFNTYKNRINIIPYQVGPLVFKVRVKNTCGWSDYAIFQYNVIDCGSGGGGQQFRVFPNPTSDEINVVLKENDELSNARSFVNIDKNIMQLTLYDFYGNVIIDKKHGNLKKMNMSRAKTGIYYLEIRTKDKTETHKVVVE